MALAESDGGRAAGRRRRTARRRPGRGDDRERDASHVRPVGSSAACPGGVSTFADVLAQIRANNTYVNVHTSDGVLPANTGPGDFRAATIRGQLQ